MSQKSISSFFSKAPVNKKAEEKAAEVSSSQEENPAKTKACEGGGESSPTLTKPDTGGKENSKSLANGDGSAKIPLRKTAVNPFFKKSKGGEDEKEESKSKDDEKNNDRNKPGDKSPKIKAKKDKPPNMYYEVQIKGSCQKVEEAKTLVMKAIYIPPR